MDSGRGKLELMYIGSGITRRDAALDGDQVVMLNRVEDLSSWQKAGGHVVGMWRKQVGMGNYPAGRLENEASRW